MKKFKGMLLACDMDGTLHYNILRNREDGCRLRLAVLLMLLAHI